MEYQNWAENPKFKNIDPKKLTLIEMLSEQAGSKKPEEILPFFLAVNAKANEMGITFNDDETEIILESLKSKMNPSDIKKIDMMLNSNNDITAIACYNDRLATRVISHLQKQGKQVPTDISVIGFDNYEMAQIISPSLTTANHPKRQLGEDAGKMILKMIAGEEVTSKVYTPTIIKGQSTAPLITKENTNE